MQKSYKLTRERKTQLEEELVFLKTVREKEVAEQIKEARSFGDLSENSEYEEAKNEQGRVFSRMAELENILAHAVLIVTDEVDTTEVGTGCRVVVEDLESMERETYFIVGSQEANPLKQRVSDESPFGKALVGRKVGDELTVETMMGVLRYRVIEIQH